MNRSLLATALLAAGLGFALPTTAASLAPTVGKIGALAAAQYGNPRFDDARLEREIDALREELDELQADRRIAHRARAELEEAESLLDDLEADGDPDEADLDEVRALLERAEGYAAVPPARPVIREYRERPVPVPVPGPVIREREVVTIEREDEEARYEARRARADAAAARREAEAQRERALAAQLEAEDARNRDAQLRAELSELSTRQTDRGLIVTLGDVLFETGKAELKRGSRRALDQLVGAMRRHPDTTVAVEGHTDSTGTRMTNLALSKRRADAVRAYLTQRGIEPSRVRTKGLGPDFPVATNRTEAGRQQNRRVEVLVQNVDE